MEKGDCLPDRPHVPLSLRGRGEKKRKSGGGGAHRGREDGWGRIRNRSFGLAGLRHLRKARKSSF